MRIQKLRSKKVEEREKVRKRREELKSKAGNTRILHYEKDRVKFWECEKEDCLFDYLKVKNQLDIIFATNYDILVWLYNHGWAKETCTACKGNVKPVALGGGNHTTLMWDNCGEDYKPQFQTKLPYTTTFLILYLIIENKLNKDTTICLLKNCSLISLNYDAFLLSRFSSLPLSLLH